MGSFKIRFMIIVLKYIRDNSPYKNYLWNESKELINELEEYKNE